VSQMYALPVLCPGVAPGGYVSSGGPELAWCAQAIADYRAKHDIREPILDTNGFTVYWRKS